MLPPGNHGPHGRCRSIPLFALRRQVASAVDVIVQVARLSSGRRLITDIAECHFDEKTENYVIIDIFKLDDHQEMPRLVWTGTKPATLEQLRFEGLVDQMELTKPMLV